MDGVFKIDFDAVEENTKKIFRLNTTKNAMGEHFQIPVMVIKGSKGPTLGVTAALHGNELNGISIVHSLWDKYNPEDLCGTLVLVPVLNVPGLLNGKREFLDGSDLNRIMPGKPSGNASQVYAHIILEELVKKFDYFIDLHTASFGRINSLYIRADMNDEVIARMAELQEPQIIVNTKGSKGTLRHEAALLGIPSITIEVGDPQVFQKKMIKPSIFGISNVMVDIGMLNEEPYAINHTPVVCKGSGWIYAKDGGILRVFPALTDQVKKGDVVATICDIFGNKVDTIVAPKDAVVVAKATNPVCGVGSRVIHLGTIWEDYEEVT